MQYTLNTKQMRYFLLLFIGVFLFQVSCSDNKLNDLSGTYRNIDDYSETKIERVNDSEYQIISPDGKVKIETKRDGNKLIGNFQGMKIECEFNSTFDSTFNKSNGKLMFTCKKIN